MMRYVLAAAALTVAAHVLEALPLACDAFGASWRPVCAAVADNAVHGAVGFLVAGAGSYAAVGAVRPRTAAACALCACLVDADGCLGPHELNALNRATGSGDLAAMMIEIGAHIRWGRNTRDNPAPCAHIMRAGGGMLR